ncbi:MAG: hypothetical protein QOF57_2146 [Frankiaceae bacterium]|jgi:hypothetical protein|nr:hypothetical protein [Frankiaceae bacterium]
MAGRAVFHVTPYVNGWTLKQEGADDGRGELGAWDHKFLAIDHAKELARSAGLGQVIVHGKDGQIQQEFTYGADPRGSKG